MKLIRKIADFLLSTYLFIATASACLVLTTYLLTNQKPQLTALTWLVFFSTILIYNFHKVSTLFSESPFSISVFAERFKRFTPSTKIMTAVSVSGIIISGLFVQPETLLCFIPLAIITLAYSVPVLKIRGTKKRLREIFLVKISTLAFVWSFTTVTLPLIDSRIDLLTKSSVALFIERFLFMFAICIPFEIRDMEQEKKWNNKTLPLVVGVNVSKLIAIFSLCIFSFLIYFQFGKSQTAENSFALPLYCSAIVAALLILFSSQHRSKYYCRIFVDGTMQLQFILLLLVNSF